MTLQNAPLMVLTNRIENPFGPGCGHCDLLGTNYRPTCWACQENLEPNQSDDRRPKNEHLAKVLYDLAARARRGERISHDVYVLIGRSSRTYGDVTKDITPCFGQFAGRHQALIVLMGGIPQFINVHPFPIVVQSVHTGMAHEPIVTLQQGQAARLASDVVDILAIQNEAPRMGTRCLITF